MRVILLITCFVTLLICYSLSSAQSITPGRTRTSFNDDWRFKLGDAAGTEGKLSYDKIKDWLLPVGNEFVSVGLPRPSASVGVDVPYTRSDFSDSDWRKLDLPHDWAIEGDFQQSLPGETGKRPFEGV